MLEVVSCCCIILLWRSRNEDVSGVRHGTMGIRTCIRVRVSDNEFRNMEGTAEQDTEEMLRVMK